MSWRRGFREGFAAGLGALDLVLPVALLGADSHHVRVDPERPGGDDQGAAPMSPRVTFLGWVTPLAETGILVKMVVVNAGMVT